MTEVIGYHFAGATLRDGRPLPRKGDVLTHEGGVVPCESGLHASEHALDALGFAPGAMVARVRLSGVVIAHGGDKYAASVRENLTDYMDATRTLHEFACWCATQTLDREEAAGRIVDPRSRRAVAVKLDWLGGRATDGQLAAAGAAARAAAWDAAWDAAGAAAGDAAWDAAWAAAWDAAWAAAGAHAWAHAWDAAWDAARAAAWAAARDAARAAARAAQRDELDRRICVLLDEVRP